MSIIKKTIQNSIAMTHPQIVLEWHPCLNGELTPENVKVGSNKKVWWKCQKGHEWQAMVYHRTRHNSKCPYCSGRYAITGENDLQTLRPNIAKEWHPIKNKNLLPTDVKLGSNHKVWWICESGHEWQAIICDRTRKDGSNCPYCSGNLNIQGETDLKTIYPDIAKEWHPTKNGKLTACDFTKCSGKKVWWKCERGHEWTATIISRTRMNAGCPYCAGKLPIQGQTDLVSYAPDLIAEWHFAKNRNLQPSDVTFSSGKKVWWICESGHEWQAVISTRTGKDKCGCPYCVGRYAIQGETDLATKHPNLAKEWNVEKNKSLLISQVKPSSNRKVWWRCEKGHEWQAIISHRTRDNTKCPYCSGYFAITGETDLATLNPRLAKEWHPTKNKRIIITQMTVHSSKKVWWLCNKCHHEWRQAIIIRTRGSMCPRCFNNW